MTTSTTAQDPHGFELPCPNCGHRLLAHSEHGSCSVCRRETNPFASGTPRKQYDICTLSSSDVRAAHEKAGERG